MFGINKALINDFMVANECKLIKLITGETMCLVH
jgi:hypothetical protein